MAKKQSDAGSDIPTTRYRPIGDRLILIRREGESVKGGIILPDKAKETPAIGLVIATGPGAPHRATGRVVPVPCERGDEVIFTKFAGMEIEEGDRKLTVLSAEDVLAVISKD